MLALFFDNLEQEQKNVRTYVQDALSSMIEIYVNIAEDSPIYDELQQIILKAVQKVKERDLPRHRNRVS
jgi:proteasome component ECM29